MTSAFDSTSGRRRVGIGRLRPPRTKRHAGRRAPVRVALLSLVALSPAACEQKPNPKQSVIVLGFDGMDPRLTEQMMDEGRLPNFARLRDRGSFKPLQTVTPPQSPVAWATFATGLNPGGHGLFDFIHRDPDPPDQKSGIKPYSAMARTVPETTWLSRIFSVFFGDSISWGDYEIPLVSSRHELLRRGTPFWSTLTQAGIPAWIYRLPANFPAIEVKGAPFYCLTDMGTPDLTEGMGEFSYYTDGPFDFNKSISGGKAYPVQVVNGMVMPAKPLVRGIVKTVVSPTRFVVQGWTGFPERLDDYAGCVAVFRRSGNQGDCIRSITSVDPDAREITLESPCDFKVQPSSLVKVYSRCKFRGPSNTTIKKKQPSGLTERAVTDFTVYVDPEDPVACIEFNGTKLILREGEWSGWQSVEFPMAYGWSNKLMLPPVQAMCRLYLKQLRPHFELYVSPFNYDPMEPIIPICMPEGFSADVARATGRYYTQGLPEDTKALSHHVLSRDEFLRQADIVEEERERLLDYALDHFGGGFLFFYYGGTDLVAHMFWGTRDPEHPGVTDEEREKYGHVIERYYICADRMLGRTLDRFPDASLLLISDHGFETFSRGFNLNTWLADNGYTTMLVPNRRSLPLNFDFSKTRAYGLGINGLYVNLKGREQDGIVDPADKQALLDEISRKLLAVVDPETGRKVIAEVYQSDRVYEGPYVDIAPDLQVGYARGYRGSWSTILGEFPKAIIEDNLDAWGADHCIATDLVPGIILANRPITAETPGLIDLAPTVLSLFDLAPPPELEGQDVFQ